MKTGNFAYNMQVKYVLLPMKENATPTLGRFHISWDASFQIVVIFRLKIFRKIRQFFISDFLNTKIPKRRRTWVTYRTVFKIQRKFIRISADWFVCLFSGLTGVSCDTGRGYSGKAVANSCASLFTSSSSTQVSLTGCSPAVCSLPESQVGYKKTN